MFLHIHKWRIVGCFMEISVIFRHSFFCVQSRLKVKMWHETEVAFYLVKYLLSFLIGFLCLQTFVILFNFFFKYFFFGGKRWRKKSLEGLNFVCIKIIYFIKSISLLLLNWPADLLTWNHNNDDFFQLHSLSCVRESEFIGAK
jgi:hypothetical protein